MAVGLRPQGTFAIFAHTPKEAAYGTAVADASITKWYALSEPAGAEVTKELIFDEDLIKNNEFAQDYSYMVELWRDATLPIALPATSEASGFIWAAALGTINTTGAGPYTHTITALNTATSDQLASTSIIVGNRAQTATFKKYKGCIPNEVKLSVENRGRVMLNTTWFTDGTEADASAFAVPTSLSTQTPFYGKNATFKMADAGSGLTDFTSLLRGFDITWNNNLSREDAHGQIAAGLNLTQLRYGQRTLTCTIKIWGSKGDAFYSSDFLNGTLKDIELKCINGSDDITFNLDRCVVMNVKDTYDNIRNVLELEIKPFTITAAGTSPIQVVVNNTIPVYLG